MQRHAPDHAFHALNFDGGLLMKILANKRLLSLAIAPFALFTACAGLTPEEQAEYSNLQNEMRRIQVEEIAPRQEQLQKIISGQMVVDVTQLQARVNQIRNEKLHPLEEELVGLRSSEELLAAPGTKVELEELNTRLAELDALTATLLAQVEEHRDQRDAAKAAAAEQLEEQIVGLRIERDALQQQLEELLHDTDLRAGEITESLTDLREQLEALEPGSGDAAGIEANIIELEDEWDAIHATESELKAELEAEITEIQTQIDVLLALIDDSTGAINTQFTNLIHALEVSIHDLSEEKADVIRLIHELELSAPDELQQTIEEIETLIEKVVTGELRPLIEQINASIAGGDPIAIAREQLRAELEEWLSELSAMKDRIAELGSKSFESMLDGLDLGAFSGFGG